MTDVTRSDRPLSPHLTIWRPRLNFVTSFAHRATGCALGLPLVLIIWWFHGAASSPERFGFVDGLLTSWFGGLVLLGLVACFWYHFFNGIRHLIWDTGHGLEMETADKLGWAAIAAAALMTVITFFVAW